MNILLTSSVVVSLVEPVGWGIDGTAPSRSSNWPESDWSPDLTLLLKQFKTVYNIIYFIVL